MAPATRSVDWPDFELRTKTASTRALARGLTYAPSSKAPAQRGPQGRSALEQVRRVAFQADGHSHGVDRHAPIREVGSVLQRPPPVGWVVARGPVRRHGELEVEPVPVVVHA